MRVAITMAPSAKKNNPKVTTPVNWRDPDVHKTTGHNSNNLQNTPLSFVRELRASHNCGRLCLFPSSVDDPASFCDTLPHFPVSATFTVLPHFSLLISSYQSQSSPSAVELGGTVVITKSVCTKAQICVFLY